MELEINVSPAREGRWIVVFGNRGLSSRGYADKCEAIAKAVELARSTAGSLIVRGTDGEIQSTRSFAKRGAFLS